MPRLFGATWVPHDYLRRKLPPAADEHISNQLHANRIWNALRDPSPNLIDVKVSIDVLLERANQSWWKRLWRSRP